MVTESFTIEEFSQVLSDAGYLYDKLGWISGEYCFAVDLGKQVSIRIRSSIHHNGTAASAGEDSIRLWLAYKGQSLAAKDVPTGLNERYIQRTHGWQERLVTAIEKLKLFRQELGDCRACGKPNIARVSRTAKNPGRVFTKCIECNQWGNWLDTDAILSQSVMPLLGVEKSNLNRLDEKGNREKGLSSPSSGILDTAIADSLHGKTHEGAPDSDLSEHQTLNVSVSTLGEVESANTIHSDKQEREWRIANLLDVGEKKGNDDGQSNSSSTVSNSASDVASYRSSSVASRGIGKQSQDIGTLEKIGDRGHLTNTVTTAASDDSLTTGLSFLSSASALKSIEMLETRFGYFPKLFLMDGKTIEVSEVIKCWPQDRLLYFRVRCGTDTIDLYHDVDKDAWYFVS